MSFASAIQAELKFSVGITVQNAQLLINLVICIIYNDRLSLASNRYKNAKTLTANST